jgi:kynureninase
VAVSSREDGAAHHRHEAGHGWVERGGVPGRDARQAVVPGPLGHSRPPLTNPLAAHYSRFRVGERILLTGHSHQAWPDVGFEAQQRAWLDAAEFVDDKWERAAAQAEQVRAGFARLLGDAAANIALGQNTHELVTRWLSALPFRDRRRIVTTTGEFHTIRRQLDRLAEEGVEVIKVSARPVDDLADRLTRAIDDRTLAVMISSVLFETADIVPGLDRVAAACETPGASLLVDAYHHLNVVPFDLRAMGLESAFVTGGGYKYCQLGEGNCFLRVPAGARLRPVLTGWFAEFEALASTPAGAVVAYPPGAGAFAGATYDPTSHYRAAAVFDFHAAQGLTASRLRGISVHQVGLLAREFAALNVDPAVADAVDVPAERRAGFLAIRTSGAGRAVRALRQASVFADSRGDILRLGPAPYVSDDQLCAAIATLSRLITGV